MWGSANQNAAALHLLEMAFETEIRIARGEHLGIDRSVNSVTNGAAFPRCFVFEHVRPALGGMAAKATFVFGKQCGAAAHVNRAFVGRMAVGTGHPSLGHRMMAGQIELAADVAVALVADGFRRAGRLDRETRAIAARSRAT